MNKVICKHCDILPLHNVDVSIASCVTLKLHAVPRTLSRNHMENQGSWCSWNGRARKEKLFCWVMLTFASVIIIALPAFELNAMRRALSLVVKELSISNAQMSRSLGIALDSTLE